jgi:diguanylate cyclase (GGDEF)-like protein
LCYLDLDQFKVINDTCGHAAGDPLLRHVSGELKNTIQSRDTVARLGGDEFGVLMESCSLENATRVANELREAVEKFRFTWDSQAFAIGVSIGMVPITRASGGLASVMIAADNACYKAKEQGRNRIHIYHEDDAELARRYQEKGWVSRIDQSLDENRFELWRQPIVPTGTGSGIGQPHHFEILLRMIDDDGTLIAPGAFLPAAERYSLAPKID